MALPKVKPWVRPLQTVDSFKIASMAWHEKINILNNLAFPSSQFVLPKRFGLLQNISLYLPLHGVGGMIIPTYIFLKNVQSQQFFSQPTSCWPFSKYYRKQKCLLIQVNSLGSFWQICALGPYHYLPSDLCTFDKCLSWSFYEFYS